LLGALQVASAGSSAGSSAAWYPYRQTNVGVAVGFFANANHMASLLVISLPFMAALAALARGRNIQRYSGLLAILAAVALVVVVGIALNGSLAGYSLALPVLAASALIVLPRPNRLRAWAVGLVALAGVAALGALASSAVDATRLDQQANTSVQSRAVILQTTTKAIGDFMPFGSGLGSFLRVYRLYESPDAVTNEYAIHAHNDYAELALELGVPGIILMLIFLGWWLTAVWAVWRKGEGGPFAQAATIASAALLVHSLVDFPLRTAAMSACFALCLGLLADRRAPRPKEPTDLRPTRHLVIG
jgi:O-antigen ligase